MMKARLILLLVAVLSSCGADTGNEGINNADTTAIKKPFRVVAFYHSKQNDIDQYHLEKITHLIFCFTHLKGNEMAIDNVQDSLLLTHIISLKEKYKQLKVLISFGGWSGCENCSAVFANDDSRKQFVQSTKELLNKYHADGIDLDWESPVIGGYGNHKHSPADKLHFTLLVKELRNALAPAAEICFDANCFDAYLQNSIDWKAVMPLVDWVNLMSYGLFSPDGNFTCHHAALYSSDEQYDSADKGTRFLDSIGVPKEKIIIGAAFYAIAFTGVDSLHHGLFQKGTQLHDIPFKKMQQEFPLSKGYKEYWDAVSQVPYLYSAATKTFVSYDNKRSVSLKTNYALTHSLGGIMFWKLNNDYFENGLLQAIDSTVVN